MDLQYSIHCSSLKDDPHQYTLSTYHKLWPTFQTPHLKETNIRLTTYTGEVVPLIGAIDVKVSHSQQEKNLNLQVVRGDGPSLLGRDWLRIIRLDWPRLDQLQQVSDKWREVVDRFKDAFKEELGHIKGHIKGHKGKIQHKPDARSQFFRARNVPYALKNRIEKELDHLENEGVIERVSCQS